MANLPKFPNFKSFVSNTNELDRYLQERYLQDMNFAGGVDNFRVFNSRVDIMADIPLMLRDPIIASAMAVLMETAFQPLPGQPLFYTESKYAAVKTELDAFHRDFSIDEFMLTIAYNLLAYGNVPIQLHWDKNFQLQRFSYLQSLREVIPVQLSGRTVGYMTQGEYHEPHEYLYAQLLHYRDLGLGMVNIRPGRAEGEDRLINEFVMAPSYISAAARPWKSVKIIEDSLLMMRMDQSNFFRIIGVKTGDSVTSKNAIKLLNFYRQIFKKVRRMSFDGNGMSGTGTSNEYEVVLPVTDSQTIDVKEVGGQVEVRALKDLEIMYQRLFSSLRMQPSFIGFSQEASQLGGDAATTRWDERWARTAKALVFSASAATKQLDRLFLRSRGYNVTEDDFSYRFPTLSTAEDEERRIGMEKYAQTVTTVASAMDHSGVPYNKKYFMRTLMANCFNGTNLDMEQLFDVDESATDKAMEQVIAARKRMPENPSLVEHDLWDNTKFLVASGFIPESALKNVKGPNDKALFNSAGAIDAEFSRSDLSPDMLKLLQPEVEEDADTHISYQRYLAMTDIAAAADYRVTLAPLVKIAEGFNREQFKQVPRKKDQELFQIPLKHEILSAVDVLGAKDLSSGASAQIEDLYIVDGAYYLEGTDLINYLYQADRGERHITVKRMHIKP
jgi:hypothetical protein